MSVLGLPLPWQAVAAALLCGAVAVFVIVRAICRPVSSAYRQLDTDGRARARETVLLALVFGCAATLSADNVVGYARHGLGDSLPLAIIFYGALDGAAIFLLSMLARRSAREHSTKVIRSWVWGLLAASAAVNWLHAPHSLSAQVLSAIMPVIAGGLAELWLHDIRGTRVENAARPDVSRRLDFSRWLYPGERIRVTRAMAADAGLSAEQATQQVRAERAAAALFRLRTILSAASTPDGDGDKHTVIRAWRAHHAENRVRSAFTRVGFAQDGIPEMVLRLMQVRVLIPGFAQLDYSSPDAARAAIGSLIQGEKKPPARTAAPLPPPNSGNGGGGATVFPLRGGSKALARVYWDEQIAAGKNPEDIPAAGLVAAAGLSETSSLGRQWKREWKQERPAETDTDRQNEVSG